jgi:formylglycine-generating enzyme required for sulfatase activity
LYLIVVCLLLGAFPFGASGCGARRAAPDDRDGSAAADCPAGYVRIEPGTFMMGSPESEEGRDDDETQHPVTITRAYCMKATEVTQGAWQAVMGSNPSEFKNCGASCPVEQVSWGDAVGFANALSRREGLQECYAGSTFVGLTCTGYRLPTEAEWEYAARAGTTEAIYGNLDSVAWFSVNSGRASHPVGQKQPNAWGLYDMLGNVYEWTGDWYAAEVGVAVDPTGSPASSFRVLRGGSWGGRARRDARAAGRRFSNDASSALGFRLVRTASSGSESVKSVSVAPAAVPSSGATGGCPAGYLLIAPGSFVRGWPDGEQEWIYHEQEWPLVNVTITYALCMKATEVTQGEWQAVMGNNPSNFKGCGADCPVEQVSWDDAVGYANALSRRDGLAECYDGTTFAGFTCKGYRLPTGAEWEYSALAGMRRARYDNLDLIAWFSANSGSKTHKVAQKQPNAWGLYDMLGNVEEWTGMFPFPSPGDDLTQTDPFMANVAGEYREARGGGWKNVGMDQIAQPSLGGPGSNDTGFRLVLGLRPATVAVTCNVDDASILIDGREVGRTRLNQVVELQVPPDERYPDARYFEVQRGGYESVAASVSLTPGGRSSVTIQLAVASAAPKAGACPAGYVRIAPGTFVMGSPESEEGRFDNESQHSVTITRAFCMKATEVTQGEWQAVMGSNPSKFANCGANCPVEQVNWDDAVGYANALSRREGLPECYAGSTFTGLTCTGYRLPTEAEWEYAARAGTTAANYGNIDTVAWYTANSGAATHPVVQKQPSAFGLYDMLGNVWEWTGDHPGEYADAVTDPTGPATGSYRVFRGGSWYTAARHARAALRGNDAPGTRDFVLGFRLSRTEP